MQKENVIVYFGEGRGKTAAALGNALLAAQSGAEVNIIQFLKRKQEDSEDIIKRLEPQIKLFRFEKTSRDYDSLSDEEKKEESIFIRNGINFARKVLTTGSCRLLILDEVLGLVDEGILSSEELCELMRLASDETQLIMTGRILNSEVAGCADSVYAIEPAAGK